VATGFFGMNFEGHFEALFFKPSAAGGIFHNTAIIAVASGAWRHWLRLS
jgi:hypothetical protein